MLKLTPCMKARHYYVKVSAHLPFTNVKRTETVNIPLKIVIKRASLLCGMSLKVRDSTSTRLATLSRESERRKAKIKIYGSITSALLA